MQSPYLRHIVCVSIWFIAIIFKQAQASPFGLTDSGNDSFQAKAWVKLSNRSLSSNKALSYAFADSAYKLYSELGNKNGMGDALVRMGLAQNAMGQYDEAIENYQSALTLFNELKNMNKQAKVLNNIGYSQMHKGLYDEAISNYHLSLEIRQKINDSSGIASCYTNVAIVYAIKNDLKQAEKYFRQSIDLYRRLKDDNMLYKNLLNLGGVYKDKGQHQKSIDQIRMVLTYYTKLNIQGEIGRCHYIFGANFEELKLYDSAFMHYNKALKIYEKIDDKKQIAGTRLKLAGIADKRKDFASAIEQSKIALEMARKMKTMQIEMQTHASMSKSYAHMGDYKNAYESRLEYEKIKDSIFSQESNQKIMELEAKYQAKLKKQKIDSLTVENKISELELNKKKNFNYLLTGILLLLLVVILLIYNQYRINGKNNEELMKKNRIIEKSLEEKEILIREIHHRVKNNLQFIWSMFNLQTRHVRDKVALNTLVEGKNRIKTMALIHQKLYQTDNLTGIDMSDYVPGLAANIFETYNVNKDQIELKLDIEKIILDIDTAIPLGLIMNELITNSLKHSSKNNPNLEIEISLKRVDNGNMVLKIKDNGPGLPESMSPETVDTFGFKLVNSLARQLKAEIHWKSDHGTETSILLKNPPL